MAPRAESLLAGQYFLAVHGLSLVRTLFVDEAAAMASTEAMRVIAADFDELPHSLSIPLTELDVEAGYTQWSSRDLMGLTRPSKVKSQSCTRC